MLTIGGASMMSLNSFQNAFASGSNTEKMPVLFIGHGSPMNAIENNYYSREWQKIA